MLRGLQVSFKLELWEQPKVELGSGGREVANMKIASAGVKIPKKMSWSLNRLLNYTTVLNEDLLECVLAVPMWENN